MAETPPTPPWQRPWDALDAGLEQLRACRDVAELVERACPLAMECCGSDHVALGRIRDGVWSPWRQTGGEDAAVALVPRSPTALEETPTERDVVRTGEVATRGERRATDDQRTGPPVVVAGVRSAGRVVGLLHVAARDATDPVIVEAYADALSSVFALLDVQHRVRAQDRVLDGLLGEIDDLSRNVPVELVADPRAASPGPLPPTDVRADGVRDQLTARQREVLDLMLAGRSNAQIAERLVLSVPTVKTHVRGVLRAVGAVNRSEAIARFGRGAEDQPGG